MRRTMRLHVVSVRFAVFFVSLAVFSLPLHPAYADTGFFRINPGGRATGMGETSSLVVDPTSIPENPALASFLFDSHGVKASMSHAAWWPVATEIDLDYTHQGLYGTFVAKPFGKDDERTAYLGFGLNNKEFYIDNRPMGSDFFPQEQRESFQTATFSIAVRSILELGVGFNFNYYKIDYEPNISYEPLYRRDLTGSSMDFGLYARWQSPRIPLYKVNKEKPDTEMLSLQIIPAIAFTQNDNTIEETVSRQSFHRYWRYGLSLEFKFMYQDMPVLSLMRVDEIKDLEYRKHNSAYNQGYQFGFLNTFEYRNGISEDVAYDYEFDTRGITVKSDGLFQILNRRYPDMPVVPRYFTRHFNLEYTESTWKSDSSIVNDIMWNTFNISWHP